MKSKDIVLTPKKLIAAVLAFILSTVLIYLLAGWLSGTGKTVSLSPTPEPSLVADTERAQVIRLLEATYTFDYQDPTGIETNCATVIELTHGIGGCPQAGIDYLVARETVRSIVIDRLELGSEDAATHTWKADITLIKNGVSQPVHATVQYHLAPQSFLPVITGE